MVTMRAWDFYDRNPLRDRMAAFVADSCHLRKVVVSSDTLQLVRLYDDDIGKIVGVSS